MTCNTGSFDECCTISMDIIVPISGSLSGSLPRYKVKHGSPWVIGNSLIGINDRKESCVLTRHVFGNFSKNK